MWWIGLSGTQAAGVEFLQCGQVGGDAFDRVDHQIGELVEVSPRERGAQRGAVGRPRVALVGQQVDPRRGPDRLVVAGLLGFAAMSCATLREMFDIDMRYFSLTMLHIDLKLFDDVQDRTLELNVDHLAADVHRFHRA